MASILSDEATLAGTCADTPCHPDATCADDTPVAGVYTCTCNDGFEGDGYDCSGDHSHFNQNAFTAVLRTVTNHTSFGNIVKQSPFHRPENLAKMSTKHYCGWEHLEIAGSCST